MLTAAVTEAAHVCISCYQCDVQRISPLAACAPRQQWHHNLPAAVLASCALTNLLQPFWELTRLHLGCETASKRGGAAQAQRGSSVTMAAAHS